MANSKRKYLKGILVVVIALGFLGLYLKKESAIHHRVVAMKAYWHEYANSRKVDTSFADIVGLDSIPSLQDEEGAWYTKYHFTAHSGGGISGYISTNSLEAWQQSYRNGNRVFDADMRFTTDSMLILKHSWTDNQELENEPLSESQWGVNPFSLSIYIYKEANPMKYAEFMQKKIFHRFSPMSCETMLRFMEEHTDVYVSVDMKGTDDEYRKGYEALVEESQKVSTELLDRIIVGVNTDEQYKTVTALWPFRNYQYRYPHPENWSVLAKFLIENNIHVVTFDHQQAIEQGPQILRSKGIHLRAATVDYISDMKKYYNLGFDGAVTNWLVERDWAEFIEK